MKKKALVRFFRFFFILLSILLFLTWLYTSSLLGVDGKSIAHYKELKQELREQGYNARLFVISGRRWKLDNWFLNTFGGAASRSKHKKGEAIDVIVLD